MSILSRIHNVFRKGNLQREIDEELADHLDNAVATGRKRQEAERALGSALRHREASTDIKLANWLDSLRADTIFGLRQLRRRPTVTAAAIISLALAIGAVTSAFRLIDAVLLRPLPVAAPQSLFVVGYTYIDDVTGKTEEGDSFSYPQFSAFREAAKDKAAELVRNQTIRERLLATLSLFFAAVALILAAVGLYGVLNYSVLQRRREIGIRMALGARTGHVVRQVSADVFLMLILGSGIGLAAGLASERFVESLLFEVKGADLGLLATPFLTLFAAAFLAALPPVIAAIKTDPSTALRSE